MRFLEGGDPLSARDRVAFVEKTPRVRVRPHARDGDDFKNWECGPRGDAGRPAAGGYEYDAGSQAWCDARLVQLGYVLP